MNTVLAEKRLPSNQVIQILQGDLTVEEVDAIVNAANERLQHGGAADGRFLVGASFVALNREDQRVIERFANQ